MSASWFVTAERRRRGVARLVHDIDGASAPVIDRVGIAQRPFVVSATPRTAASTGAWSGLPSPAPTDHVRTDTEQLAGSNLTIAGAGRNRIITLVANVPFNDSGTMKCGLIDLYFDQDGRLAWTSNILLMENADIPTA